MNYLWAYMNQKDWNDKRKYIFAMLILSLVAAMTGLFLWLVIRNWTLSSPEWLFCFIGYPVVITWIVGFIYFANHRFHAPRTHRSSCVIYQFSTGERMKKQA